jgi:prepilin-type N-terminal cleavage/methylation domain-containing protein
MKKEEGFTLIELVITMVLIGIVAFIVGKALSEGAKAYFQTDSRKAALDEGRVALERMTRETRNVRSRGKDADADGYIDADIWTANATQFCFINTDGARISFRYAGGEITREEGGGACPGAGGDKLASNVNSFNFSYTYEGGSNITAIRRIKIDISTQVDTETIPLSSEVYLRNMK